MEMERQQEQRKIVLWLIHLGIKEYNIDEESVDIWGTVKNKKLKELVEKGFYLEKDRLKYKWRKVTKTT